MARKKKHEEHENHERWLVSYADFITLLFAFFVVMYSISSVNEGKFRVVSQSIVEALNPLIPMSATTLRFQPDSQGGPTSNRAISIDMQVYKKLSEAIKAIDATGRVKVAQGERGVTISITDTMLFKPGEALVLSESQETLLRVASVLTDFPHQIRIEGHTDNVPIHTKEFPTNWELSASRALNITRFLTEGGYLPSERLAASGYGEFHPLTPNDTPEGRSQNRRVELVILKELKADGGANEVISAIKKPCVPTGLPGGCESDEP
jgi:chemotaxis protein MotB